MQPRVQQATSTHQDGSAGGKTWRTLDEAKDRLERRYLIAVLKRARGYITTAARLAGRERTFFHRLLAKHKIDARQFRPGHQSSHTRSVASTPTPPTPERSWFGVPIESGKKPVTFH